MKDIPLHEKKEFRDMREMVEFIGEEYGDRVAYRFRLNPHDKEAVTVSYTQLRQEVRALATELTGTTVVTVAQRVSSVKDCDLILVLDGGRIIGMGGHESLLAECPEYREISESQMGGAFVE